MSTLLVPSSSPKRRSIKKKTLESLILRTGATRTDPSVVVTPTKKNNVSEVLIGTAPIPGSVRRLSDPDVAVTVEELKRQMKADPSLARSFLKDAGILEIKKYIVAKYG